MGRRVSIWEAEAERRTDRAAARTSATESRENRQRIQQEATSGHKSLSLETRRLERQRHLDHQREEIHPSHIQATLQALQEQQNPLPPGKRPTVGFLAPAIPEESQMSEKLVPVPVREWRTEP
jgi:hypothetical protein